MLVLVKGGNVQALSFTRDAVKNLSGARCLDGAFGYGNDLVRCLLYTSGRPGPQGIGFPYSSVHVRMNMGGVRMKLIFKARI